MESLVYKSEYATVTYNSEKRMMILLWDGSPSAEEYKKPFLTMLAYGSKFPVDGMMSDISKQGIINPDNRKKK